MSKELFVLDYAECVEKLKKYNFIKKAFREACQGDKNATEVFTRLEKFLKELRKVSYTLQGTKNTSDVSNVISTLDKCLQYYEENCKDYNVPTRDRCIECDNVKEIIKEKMCFECNASYQAGDYYDNFAARFDSLSDDLQGHLKDEFNLFVNAIEDMREKFSPEKYHKMTEIAKKLHKDLPILEEDLDEDFQSDEEDEDEDDDEYNVCLKRKREDCNDSDYLKALKIIIPPKDYNYVMDNIGDENKLRKFASEKSCIYQLKRKFRDFPDQFEILPGIYRSVSSAKEARAKDEFPDGKTTIVKINLY